jgi:hypothetical protein
MNPASSAAATRGATSHPLGVFEIITRSAPEASTAARMAARLVSAV